MIPRSVLVLFLAPCVLTAACKSGSGLGCKEPYAEYFKPAVRVYFDTGSDDPGEIDAFQDGSLNAAVDFLGLNFPILVREGVAPEALDARLGDEKERLKELETKEKEAIAATVANDPKSDGPARLARIDRAEQEKRVAEIEKRTRREDGTRLDGDWFVGPRFAIGITSPVGDAGDDGGDSSSDAPVVYVSGGFYADFQKGGEPLGDEEGLGVRLEFGYMYAVSADESLSNDDDGAVFVGLSVNL